MNDEQLLRYSRALMLNNFDVAGQESLLKATVLIVGLGGLGSPVAMYLAAAGVGQLILVDDDLVELSNLQRQIAHTSLDIGINKAVSAAQTLKALNPDIKIEVISSRLVGKALDAEVARSDAVVDCTDNFATRFALNKSCWQHKVPLISGAAIRMEGQLSVFDARASDSPCYSCLYQAEEELNLSCSHNGVMAPLTGIIGSMQALECIKVLSGFGTPVIGKLVLIDAATMQIRELRLQKKPGCQVCGD